MLQKTVLAALLLLGTLATTSRAQLDASSASAFAQIPPCALTCLGQYSPVIGCSLVDIKCQCASTNSTAILQPCLMQNCTYDETFKLLHVQADLCNKPRDSRTDKVRVTAYVTGIITIIAISMRFISRHLGGSRYWWDDWLHLISGILVIPMTVALLMNAEAGLGNHIWDLSYNQVVNIGRWTYIVTIFWAFELLLLKYSILCLYLRIFPNPWLKRFSIGFAVFTTLFTMPLIGMAAFQCIPIYSIWDLRAQRTAKCIDWIAVLRATVVYEVIAEIILFGLPIPIVLGLKLKRSKKIQLITFFSLGLCVIGVSIARLPTLPGVVNSSDQPYTTVGATILGFGASVTGHVCAAIPTVRALARLICGSNHFDGSRFKGTSSNDATRSSKRSAFWNSTNNDSTNHSSHMRSVISSPNKSSDLGRMDHFGPSPPGTRADGGAMMRNDASLELAPIPARERQQVYHQGPQRGRERVAYMGGRSRWSRAAGDGGMDPALYRDERWNDELEDTSSERRILSDEFFGSSIHGRVAVPEDVYHSQRPCPHCGHSTSKIG